MWTKEKPRTNTNTIFVNKAHNVYKANTLIKDDIRSLINKFI